MHNQHKVAQGHSNQWWVKSLLVLAGLLLPVSIFLSWFAFLILDDARFARTVTPVIDSPTVQTELARLLVTSVEAALAAAEAESAEARTLIESAGGANGVVDDIAAVVDAVVPSPEFRAVWQETNYLAHVGMTRFLRGETIVPGTAPDELALTIANVGDALNIDPASPEGRALAAIPDHLAPSFSVLKGIDVPAINQLVDHARLIALMVSGISALMLGIGLWFSRNRRRALILVSLVGLLSIPIAILIRTVMNDELGKLSGSEREIAHAYATALTSSLETGLLMAGIVGAVVALLAWIWPRFDRTAPVA
jgi:hypothetical protein